MLNPGGPLYCSTNHPKKRHSPICEALSRPASKSLCGRSGCADCGRACPTFPCRMNPCRHNSCLPFLDHADEPTSGWQVPSSPLIASDSIPGERTPRGNVAHGRRSQGGSFASEKGGKRSHMQGIAGEGEDQRALALNILKPLQTNAARSACYSQPVCRDVRGLRKSQIVTLTSAVLAPVEANVPPLVPALDVK